MHIQLFRVGVFATFLILALTPASVAVAQSYANGPQVLRLSEQATQAISLYGYFNNGRLEENIRLERVDDKIRLTAWWMAWSGDTFGIKTEITQEEFSKIWSELKIDEAFSLKDQRQDVSHAMTYQVQVVKSDKKHTAECYGISFYGSTTVFGEEGPDDAWYEIVSGILDLRGKYAHRIRPVTLNRDNKIEWDTKPKGKLVTRERAEEIAAYIRGDQTNEEEYGQLNWDSILRIGEYRNQQIVEAVVQRLSDHSEPLSRACCAYLSWLSERPATDDIKYWKEWWAENREQYDPNCDLGFTGKLKNGRVSRLGGATVGFLDVELDANENVWAITTSGRDSLYRPSYRFYRLNQASNQFEFTGDERVFSNKSERPPLVSFSRRVTASKIEFPIRHHGLGVSRNGQWGVAAIGRTNLYTPQGVDVINFQTGEIQKLQISTGDYSSPIVTDDGNYICVQNNLWDPRTRTRSSETIVFDVLNNSVKKLPSESCLPLAHVANSSHGPGFFLVQLIDNDQFQIVWCSENGSEFKPITQVFSGYFGLRSGNVNITNDGKQILVNRPNKSDERFSNEVGWLTLSTLEFTPITPQLDNYILHADANKDGSQVVFVYDKGIFKWAKE